VFLSLTTLLPLSYHSPITVLPFFYHSSTAPTPSSLDSVMTSPLGQKTISVPAPVDADTIIGGGSNRVVPYVTRYIKPASSVRLVFGIYIPYPPDPPDLRSIYPASLPHLLTTAVAKMQSEPSPSPEKPSDPEPAIMATSSNEVKTRDQIDCSPVQDTLSAEDEASTQAIPYPLSTLHIEPASSLSPQTSAIAMTQSEPFASPEVLHDSEPATMAESSNEVNTGDQTDCSPIHTTLSIEESTDFSGFTWFKNIGEEMAQKIRNLVVNVHEDTAEERGEEDNDSYDAFEPLKNRSTRDLSRIFPL
jgi:hypothetical protein